MREKPFPAARRHAADGQPSTLCREKHEKQRRQERRHRQQEDRGAADRRGHEPSGPRARDDAEREADERRDDEGRQREDAGVSCALGNELGDRPVVLHRAAEIQMQRAGEPVAILRAERTIQPVARPGRFEHLAPFGAAERLGHVVAGREPRQHERGRRHREDQHDREGKPSRDVPDHRAVTVNVSGDQRRLGGTMAGATLPRRAELATNTRGRTNWIIG